MPTATVTTPAAIKVAVPGLLHTQFQLYPNRETASLDAGLEDEGDDPEDELEEPPIDPPPDDEGKKREGVTCAGIGLCGKSDVEATTTLPNLSGAGLGVASYKLV